MKENNYLLEVDNNLKALNCKKNEILILSKPSKLVISVATTSLISFFSKNKYKDDYEQFDINQKDEKIDLNQVMLSVESTNLEKNYFALESFVNTLYSIDITETGILKIFFTYNLNTSPIIYIHVEPENLSKIRMITVLSKSLGKSPNDWELFFDEAIYLKYNFVHFTPIQLLGESNSLYSIRDHNKLNDFFTGTYEDYKNLLRKMKTKGVGSIVDIVLNHIASNSKWIEENSQAGFNLENTPHLNAAYELEKILLEYSERYQNSQVGCKAAPYVRSINDVDEIINEMSEEIINYGFHEFFKLDLGRISDELCFYMKNNLANYTNINSNLKESQLDEPELLRCLLLTIKNKGSGRFKTDVDIKAFYSLIISNRFKLTTNYKNTSFKSSSSSNSLNKEESDEENFKITVKYYLLQLNNIILNEYDFYIHEAIRNIKNYIVYNFLELKFEVVNEKNRLLTNYFTVKKHRKDQIFANNGWIYGCNDPTVNFASSGNYYLTRSLVAWGDCIKLNYNNFFNSPLKSYMITYVRTMAEMFDGFRLDNAHSTDIQVAEFLLKEARKINPELIVIAELFAGSEEREIELVNKGINLLIRETIYSKSLNDLTRELHYYGNGYEKVFGKLSNNIQVVGQRPKSILYDITHDNQTIYKTHGSSLLSHTFLSVLSFTLGPIGTTKGFDELYSFNPSVVNEDRKYYLLKETEKNEQTNMLKKFSLQKGQGTEVSLFLSSNWEVSIPLKLNLESNNFEVELEFETQSKIYYKYLIDNTIWCLNHLEPIEWDCNGNMNNVIDFTPSYSSFQVFRRFLNTIRGQIDEDYQIYMEQDEEKQILSLFWYSLNNKKGYIICHRSSFNLNEKPIDFSLQFPGLLENCLCYSYLRKALYNQIQNKQNNNLIKTDTDADFRVSFNETLILNKIIHEKFNGKSILHIKQMPPNCSFVFNFSLDNQIALKQELLNILLKDKTNLLDEFEIKDFNYLLFSCEPEELMRTGHGTYDVPGFSKFNFAGFYDLFFHFKRLRQRNSIDSALFHNIRQGDWLITYCIERLKCYPKLYNFLSSYKENYSVQPSFLKPYLFDELIKYLEVMVNNSLSILLKTKVDSIEFPFKKAAVQFIGNPSGEVTISAGLPHFSTGFMRSWGRDTFISFYGLMLTTSQFSLAKKILLDYAKVIRHGLIPNLYDEGNNPRFNARDATWFYLKALVEYVDVTADYEIFDSIIEMKYSSKKKFIECISEILASHAEGINFREVNAGTAIDENMSDDGFNISINLNFNNGFIYGGNRSNCGTWMDKMGSAYGNKGSPASSRHGANVEIVSICYLVLKWFEKYYNSKGEQFILKLKGTTVKVSDWIYLINMSFEREFYVETICDITNDSLFYLKDVLCDDKVQEKRLRPNFIIALALTPELISKEKALKCLKTFEIAFLEDNCLGVKTLYKHDIDYKGDYNNSDYTHGFNYHNGPEWLWPMGFYLMAKYNFSEDYRQVFIEKLSLQLNYINSSSWGSLPELTNSKGNYCNGSCESQAWSIATILEALFKAKLIN